MTTSSEQPLPPSPPPPPYTYPPIIIILTIILVIFFFVGFFSIYFCRCFVQNLLCMWHLRNPTAAAPVGGAATSTVVGNGLDPSIVQSFPSFAYSTVKDYRIEKYGLECAICLLEFKGIDLLRLLTTCCHVFHQECIDLWLESHNTCPVCRRNLTSPPVQSPSHENVEAAASDHHHLSFSITVKEDGDKGVSSDDKVDKFPRSHSTGHSILPNREVAEEDRFTLRLPQHVIIRGHNSSKSWSIFGEYKDKHDLDPAPGPGVSAGDHNV